MDRTDRARRVGGLIALAALAVLGFFSVWTVLPPSPAPGSAPADQFSAARAFAHVERIGAAVHVAGSPAAADVRSYIEQTLRSYGLQTQIQDAVGQNAGDSQFAMAHVQNVVAVLPGTASTGRVFAVAHYDSVQVSYGGNDDGAGVASLLETARAMAQGPRPRNDTVFVFTDAEEACLCGAEAFVDQDPLASDGGVVLNFESRGSSGPSIMFETSRDNANVVGVYASAVPYAVATSFAVEVYRRLPNDTDFTMFRESDRFTGLNSAYIDGSAVYHSPEDRPSYMDHGSLQQNGANALALTRAFAGADLAALSKPAAHDDTYFPVLSVLVRYPGWLVWPFAALAVVGVLGLAAVARRRAEVRYGRIAAGLALALIPLVLSAVAAQLLWLLLVALRPGYANMIDSWRPGFYRAGVVALVATVVLTWYGLLRRRFGGWVLAIGGLGWLALLGVVLAAFTPGGSYLAALPALAGSVAAIVALTLRGSGTQPAAAPAIGSAVLAIGAAVAVVILVPTVLLFFPALGLATGGAGAFFAAMLALAVLPLIESLYPAAEPAPAKTAGPAPAKAAEPAQADAVESGPAASAAPARRRLRSAMPALVTGALTVAFVATGLAVDTFSTVHPAPAQLMYALDTDTGTAQWVSTDSSPGSWTRRYVTHAGSVSTEFPVITDSAEVGPAQAANLPAPTVTTTSDTTSGGTRTLSLLVTPQRTVRLVYVAVENARVTAATVDGRRVPASELGDHFSVLFHAPPADGLPVTFTLAATGPVRIRAMDGSDGLTGLPGFTPRPAGVGVEGSHESELVVVAKTYTM
ncbi:MAG TPA: M28 family peptidase [Micromonosporaceae bacterium]|nr:M28 family peptidase [Micromonosporaceae bacterium]